MTIAVDPRPALFSLVPEEVAADAIKAALKAIIPKTRTISLRVAETNPNKLNLLCNRKAELILNMKAGGSDRS